MYTLFEIVLICCVIYYGIKCIVNPDSMIKKSGIATARDLQKTKIRGVALVVLGVAALILIVLLEIMF